LLIASAAQAGDREDPRERKKKFVRTCLKEGKDVSPNMKRAFRQYCECSADAVIARYTQAEIDAMERKSARTGSNDEMMQTLTPVIQPCLDWLQAEAERRQ